MFIFAINKWYPRKYGFRSHVSWIWINRSRSINLDSKWSIAISLQSVKRNIHFIYIILENLIQRYDRRKVESSVCISICVYYVWQQLANEHGVKKYGIMLSHCSCFSYVINCDSSFNQHCIWYEICRVKHKWAWSGWLPSRNSGLLHIRSVQSCTSPVTFFPFPSSALTCTLNQSLHIPASFTLNGWCNNFSYDQCCNEAGMEGWLCWWKMWPNMSILCISSLLSFNHFMHKKITTEFSLFHKLALECNTHFYT